MPQTIGTPLILINRNSAVNYKRQTERKNVEGLFTAILKFVGKCFWQNKNVKRNKTFI